MKRRTIIAAATAFATAAALTVGAGAYELNKDLGFGWSQSITVPGEEFDGADTNSVFTITFTVDASLAEMPGQEYWCIKTMINDEGWPFMADLTGPQLSDGKDSYVISTEDTEIKFTVPAEELEHLQAAGMAIMGHGITLGEITFSNDETLPEAAPAPAAEAEVSAAAETTAASTTDNPSTGVGLDTAMAAASLLTAVVMRKKK